MPLNLYRRHYRCAADHPTDSQTYESDELRPKWRNCTCPIYASGRLGDNPKFRKNTKCFTWADARTVADTWERRSMIEEPPPSDPAPTQPPSAKSRKTIRDASEACLKYYEPGGAAKATQSTWRRYKMVLGRFERFSAQRGYVYLDEWETSDVRDFCAWWKVPSVRTARSNLGGVRSFLEFCKENGWIAVNVSRYRQPHTVAQAIANKRVERSPFTDAELTRMLAACEKYGIKGWCKPYKWDGEDLMDFILISAYTGLRISDVVTFHISRLADNGDVHFRAQKNGEWIDTWIPTWLQARIRARAEKHGPYIFGKPQTTDIVSLTSPWRGRLIALWDTCGSWKEKPTHHRFRHTFVRIMLQRGVPISMIARLLGD